MINLAVHSAIIMRKESCKRWAANTALKFIEMFHIHLHVILESHISLHCWSKVFAHFNVCLAVGFPITRLSVYKFMSIIGKCVMQNRRLSGNPHFAVFGKKKSCFSSNMAIYVPKSCWHFAHFPQLYNFAY